MKRKIKKNNCWLRIVKLLCIGVVKKIIIMNCKKIFYSIFFKHCQNYTLVPQPPNSKQVGLLILDLSNSPYICHEKSYI